MFAQLKEYLKKTFGKSIKVMGKKDERFSGSFEVVIREHDRVIFSKKNGDGKPTSEVGKQQIKVAIEKSLDIWRKDKLDYIDKRAQSYFPERVQGAGGALSDSSHHRRSTSSSQHRRSSRTSGTTKRRSSGVPIKSSFHAPTGPLY